MFQVVENGNGKQFAMKRIMVNNEADLKLAKQEIAVMVRGGERVKEGRGREERGGEEEGEGRGGEGREVGREGRGGEVREREKIGEREGRGGGGEWKERPCTDGVSLIVLLCSGHLPTTATQSPSTTGPSAARVTIFMRSSL